MKPSILYELYNLTLPTGTGISTYARHIHALGRDLGYETNGLAHSWRRIDRIDPTLAEIAFFDIWNRRDSGYLQPFRNWLTTAFGAPFGVHGVPVPMRSVVVPQVENPPFDGLDNVFVASRFMDRARSHFQRFGRSASLKVNVEPTIFHATQPLPLRVAGACNIYTIHDIVPLRLPYTTMENKRYFLKLIRHLGRTADRIVTVSEAARNDLITFCGIPPEKVVNTYQTVEFSPSALAGSDEEVAQLVENVFGLQNKEYFLFYGALEPKKNIGRIVDAFMSTGIRRPLVIAGGLGWEYEDDLEKIDAANHQGFAPDGVKLSSSRVRRLSYMPLHHLVALIRCARAVVFPSLYEGFGLPVVEAMLLGTPVVTSTVASLPEVAGDAALLVNPLSVREIAAAISKIDADDDLRAELVAKGRVRALKFSREAHKSRLGRVYEETLAAARARGGVAGGAMTAEPSAIRNASFEAPQ